MLLTSGKAGEKAGEGYALVNFVLNMCEVLRSLLGIQVEILSG